MSRKTMMPSTGNAPHRGSSMGTMLTGRDVPAQQGTLLMGRDLPPGALPQGTMLAGRDRRSTAGSLQPMTVMGSIIGQVDQLALVPDYDYPPPMITPTMLAPTDKAPTVVPRESIFHTEEDKAKAVKQSIYQTLNPVERQEQDVWAINIMNTYGPCPEKYTWIRQNEPGIGGYQCDGGGHGVTDEMVAEGFGDIIELKTRKFADIRKGQRYRKWQDGVWRKVHD